MRITIKSNEISEICKVFGKVVTSKCSMPILEYVKVSGIGNAIALTASNGEVFICKTATAKVEDAKDICINYKWLKNLCDCNPNATIHLTIDEYNNILAVTCDGTIEGMAKDTEEFPTYECGRMHYTEVMRVPGQSFLEAVKEVEFARATDEVRMTMTGIYLDSQEDGLLNVVATDGRMLIRKAIQGVEPNNMHMVMPKGIYDILSAIAPYETEWLAMGETTKYLVSANGYEIRFNAIQGAYPNYKAVMPNITDMNVGVVSRHSLIASLKRVSVFGNTSSTLSRWTFRTDSSLELMSADWSVMSKIVESLPCASSHTKELSIGVSSAFALNELNHMSGNTVSLYTSYSSDGKPRPIIMLGADEYLYMLLMPMELVDLEEPSQTEGAAEGAAEDEPTEDEAVEEEAAEDEPTEDEELIF